MAKLSNTELLAKYAEETRPNVLAMLAAELDKRGL